MTIQRMRHRDLVKFRNGQAVHTPSTHPPHIRASQVAQEVFTRALVLIPQIELFTIPLKYPLLFLAPKSSTVHGICARTLQSTTL